jgi:serine/threonine-protein kinase
MGKVYEARHRNGKRVAIKTLHTELAHQPELLQRFFREGYLANKVDHPGVVSVIDDGTTPGGVPYLVMEFLEGEDLDGRIERLGGPLKLEDVLSIGVSCLDVLAAAHDRHIVHRDIKPNNVFLTGDGRVKILDFGIARLRDAKGYVATLTGVTVGTPTFMSREQAHGRQDLVDGQSDLWSLGATLSYSLTGDFLYDADSTVGFLALLMTQDPRPLRSVAPTVPRPIAEVIDRSLHHDKARRWSSAREMKEALLAAAAECGVIIPETPSLAGYIPPPRSAGPSIPELPDEAASRAVSLSLLPPELSRPAMPRPRISSLPAETLAEQPEAAHEEPPGPPMVSRNWAAWAGGMGAGAALLGVLLWAATGAHAQGVSSPTTALSSPVAAWTAPLPSGRVAPPASASASPGASVAPAVRTPPPPAADSSRQTTPREPRSPDRRRASPTGEHDLGNSRF